MIEENWCDHVQVSVWAVYTYIMHQQDNAGSEISLCVHAVCCSRWPWAAGRVGAVAGEVLWSSESIPVVPEISDPQRPTSPRGMGNAAESPASSTVSDKICMNLSSDATCGLLREMNICSLWVFNPEVQHALCSPHPFSHTACRSAFGLVSLQFVTLFSRSSADWDIFYTTPKLLPF